jgi:hypothetical protein
MGRTGRWKDAHAAFRELRGEARASVPQWARIVGIGGDATTYLVEWDRPPNYGTAPTSRRDAARRLLEAKQALDRGLITQDDFDRNAGGG